MDSDSPKNRRILILEDEKPMALALQLKLKKVGFDAEIALNGEQGLELIGQNTYDMILTDIMMPIIDGFGVLQALKDRGNQTPVIVLSNLSQSEDEKRSRDLGAKGFFVKSNTNLATIVETVQKFLH